MRCARPNPSPDPSSPCHHHHHHRAGSINSLLTSLGGNVVSFVLLSFASAKIYMNKERRANAPVPPYKILQ